MSLLATAVFAADHSNPLVPEANEVFWAAVSFLLLLALLGKFVFPRINKTLADRTANIEGKLDQADQEKQKADQLLAQYQAKLKEANVEAARILDQARANADRLETELRAKAEEQSQRIVERAQETIAAERERALQALRQEVGGLVVDLAERVVGDALDRERQSRLIDQYISELPSASVSVSGSQVPNSGGRSHS